jgi:hypothetical protein
MAGTDVSQSHTGTALVQTFQQMLERFSLKGKILAFNSDNAMSNDTQTTKLNNMDNSFREENRVRCFNHMVQLSAKALLKLFSSCITATTTDDEPAPETMPDLEVLDDKNDDEVEEGSDNGDMEDSNDKVDELEMMSEEDHENCWRRLRLSSKQFRR